MTGVAVIGAQWGDEGKGKIVDWLCERASVVVRFQGGHNAGHTLVIGDKTYKFSLLPSGIARPNKLSVIGNGVVVDPWALIAEIGRMTEQGLSITPANLLIADNAPLILPLHGELDTLRETSNSGTRIGTTKRGIGPAYEDKVGRRAIRVADLADPAALDLKLDRLTRQVSRGDRSIDLTVKEFDLLEYLLSHPRQVFTRDQILEQVWGYDFMGDSNIIEVYVRYLRLKLEEQKEKRLVHTIRGVGYVLRE